MYRFELLLTLPDGQQVQTAHLIGTDRIAELRKRLLEAGALLETFEGNDKGAVVALVTQLRASEAREDITHYLLGACQASIGLLIAQRGEGGVSLLDAVLETPVTGGAQ